MREQGATRRTAVMCGLAMVLASQVVSGMPLEQPNQDNHIIARAPDMLQGYKQQLLGRLSPSIEGSQSPRKRQSPEEFDSDLVKRVVVTVVASSSAAAKTTAAVATTSAAATSAAATSSSSLPAVTPVASASELTSTSGSASSSTSTSTSSSSKIINSKSLFSVHNKLFPAVVVAIVGIVVGVMLILITIGKCYAHAHMTAEEKAGEYGDYYNKTFKNGGIAVRGAKSLRRAFTTSKKLGSFARRNQEGTVLIDVGDEVYAVTAAVAQEYERERSALGGSSGGSRLTSNSNNPSPLRQALKNAEMNVAASQVGTKGGPYNQSAVQSWRDQNREDSLSRSISQKLTDGFRAFRGKSINEAARPVSFSSTGGGREAAYSFDSEKQDMGSMRQAEVPPTAYLPVITRGAKEWDIRPRQLETHQHLPNQTLQSKSSNSSLHSSSNLSHERHTLTDGPVPRLDNTSPRSHRQPQPRPKSILIKRDDPAAAAAAYRHRKPESSPGSDTSLQRTKTAISRRASKPSSSTSPASPRMLQQRTTAPRDSVPVYFKPSKPIASQIESNAPPTRDLFRPLPGLPPA